MYATAERIQHYRRDRQVAQRQYSELCCEAAGMALQLARVADALFGAVFSGGGFNSLAANRLVATCALSRKVPTVLLHVGDRTRAAAQRTATTVRGHQDGRPRPGADVAELGYVSRSRPADWPGGYRGARGAPRHSRPGRTTGRSAHS